MLNIKDKTYKTLILTDYGRHRVLENVIDKKGDISGYNLTHVYLGDRYNTNYTTAITDVGHAVKIIELTEDNISQIDNTFIIQLDVESSYDVCEIGVYETVGDKRYLFAYVSGLPLKKTSKKVSFTVILDLSLNITFQDFDYHDYNVVLADAEYAVKEDLTELYNSLTRTQIDLERCIQKNARLLGFNRPNVYYNEQERIAEYFKTFLLLNRFSKVVNMFDDDSLTDYFIFPELDKHSYTIKNLKDTESVMNVVGNVKNATKDNIDFTRPTSIVYSGTITSLVNCGTIFAKSEPEKDQCYFEFVITSDDVTDSSKEKYLKFTAYSYDIELEQQLTADNAKLNEPKLIGEYSIVYHITKDTEMYRDFLNKECTFTFVFNGSADEPNFDFYINDVLINSPEKIDAGYTEVINFLYKRPPSFEDYADNIRYDFISDADGSFIRLSIVPDDNSYLYEDSYEEILSDDDKDKLRFFGVFDELLRHEEIVSNYDTLTGMMFEDEIQTAHTIPNFDFLRSLKIVGDIYWRKYKLRYDFYQHLREYCTLKNYSAFMKTDIVETVKNGVVSNTHEYVMPQYYTLNNVEPTTLLTFSKALSVPEITFLANLNRS